MNEKKYNLFWDKIFNNEKILTDKEAEEIEKVIKRVRTESGFRTDTNSHPKPF